MNIKNILYGVTAVAGAELIGYWLASSGAYRIGQGQPGDGIKKLGLGFLLVYGSEYAGSPLLLPATTYLESTRAYALLKSISSMIFPKVDLIVCFPGLDGRQICYGWDQEKNATRSWRDEAKKCYNMNAFVKWSNNARQCLKDEAKKCYNMNAFAEWSNNARQCLKKDYIQI